MVGDLCVAATAGLSPTLQPGRPSITLCSYKGTRQRPLLWFFSPKNFSEPSRNDAHMSGKDWIS